MEIEANELKRRLDEGQKLLLLDVRTPVEYTEMHLADSVLMPLGEWDSDRVSEMLSEHDACVVLCKSGKRSERACEKLGPASDDRVLVLAGGLERWKKLGLPLETSGQCQLHIMRQVQLVIALAVVIGTALALTVDLWFFVIPVFFVLGFLISRITGWCGMAIILSKMPWNRVD